MVIPDEIIDELVTRIARAVVKEMGSAPTHYSARALPPGKSKAWALRNLKKIPGAKKVGRDWIVSVDEFDAWLSEQDTAKFTKAIPLKKAIKNRDVDALVESSLAANGLRRVALG